MELTELERLSGTVIMICSIRCVVLWSSMVSPFIKMTFGFGFHFVSSLDHPSCGLPTHSKYPQTQSHISHNSKISPIFLCLCLILSPLDLEQLILENNKKSEDQIIKKFIQVQVTKDLRVTQNQREEIHLFVK